MAGLLGTIDPNKDSISIDSEEVTGFADDDMITISRNEDINNTIVGINGDIVVVKNPNKTGTLTLRLQETSPTNSSLLDILNDDSRGDTFQVSASRDGSNKLIPTDGWIQTQPDISYGKETNIYEWVITLRNAKVYPNPKEGFLDTLFN